MSEVIVADSKFFALLIGVDHYLPNRMPDGGFYPSLGGCVRDINHVQAFLQSRLGLADERIIKLTASNNTQAVSPEPPEKQPTYENMVASFKKVTELANAGDQVYIHYSGHGGRTTTAFQGLKGPTGLDEALVPTDIGNSEARYLRDIELAHLLKAMVDKGIVVTLVLDSCHSGGATRGIGDQRNKGGTVNVGALKRGAAIPNGASGIDTTVRPTQSEVASPAELSATWQSLTGGAASRALKPGAGWLLEPQGYVLLAACRAQESAYEFPFDGREATGRSPTGGSRRCSNSRRESVTKHCSVRCSHASTCSSRSRHHSCRVRATARCLA